MPAKKEPVYQHITSAERVIIQDRLDHNQSFKSIAIELGRSPSTISREVLRHRIREPKQKSLCANRKTCKVKALCKNCISKYRDSCRKCPQCKKFCPDFRPEQCDRIIGPPYVCNGCHKVGICGWEKYRYKSFYAEQQYENTLRERRKGFDISEEELEQIDSIIYPLLRQGQSIYHIMQIYRDEIPVSESTIRRMIDSTCLKTRNIDLRTKVKRKQRKKAPDARQKELYRKWKKGHLWEDYQKFMVEHPDTAVVQMDCVEGIREDNAVLLTLYFTPYHLQLAFILDAHTSEEVVAALDRLELALGTELFQKMFPVILTDNGHEFSDRPGIERSISGGKRTAVYYCEPNRSDEKAGCEKNHTLIRYVIPKGTSLERFTQKDISLMMDHINSYKRRSLGGNSPYEAARFWHVPNDFFLLLGLEEISPEKINLTPSLLK